MDIEESVGLQSAHSMKCQGSAKTLSCEVAVSKVRGHRPVCRTAQMPYRLTRLSLQRHSCTLYRWLAKEDRHFVCVLNMFIITKILAVLEHFSSLGCVYRSMFKRAS